MIRLWRRRVSADLVDAAVVVTAQIDVRDGQIEGLRDALLDANRRLAVAQGQLATYKARELMRAALLYRRLHADEPTEHTPRPAPGWKTSTTQRWTT